MNNKITETMVTTQSTQSTQPIQTIQTIQKRKERLFLRVTDRFKVKEEYGDIVKPNIIYFVQNRVKELQIVYDQYWTKIGSSLKKIVEMNYRIEKLIKELQGIRNNFDYIVMSSSIEEITIKLYYRDEGIEDNNRNELIGEIDIYIDENEYDEDIAEELKYLKEETLLCKSNFNLDRIRLKISNLFEYDLIRGE